MLSDARPQIFPETFCAHERLVARSPQLLLVNPGGHPWLVAAPRRTVRAIPVWRDFLGRALCFAAWLLFVGVLGIGFAVIGPLYLLCEAAQRLRAIRVRGKIG